MVAVSLDYAAPDAALTDYVSVFYNFRADVPRFEDDDRADLAQLRFMLKGSGGYRFADGHVQGGPEIQIVGPTMGVTHVWVDGPAEVFGAGLLPAGWGAMIATDASSLTNRVIDATELFGRELHDVADRLRATDSLDERVAIGNALVRDLVARGHGQSRWFTRAVDTWLQSTLSPEVDDLVAATRLSRRQVERLCKRLYGAPPKLLSRKYRALRAAVVLAKREAGIPELLEQGFYDQSHCIREIKRFTGVTPTRIQGDLNELTRLTMKRTEFAGQVAPLVAEA
ncbi:helix-turn-helix domain-containing protein [Sphingomonas sp. MAH-20]|uniref:Helix-turn-helix domain-containing protein n=1 Tax=Sphingomonas horti TaxID=2682842 RepID=A0A6I4J507_9SPHN|nr:MULTISPECIES: helix-turn-helix domain-containing protein [Sphingomonas]MBA2919160.1 helix-turn-helix domain-containing protein [Sphingomonas sp. CGMCC 1.13658]MVO79193.1 helix-turn-helix domain-containing protein [Sphingomonas horti]